ncbi:HlyD family type I secretion periplasmic adaptor subunit [Tsuneonella sp. HG222]
MNVQNTISIPAERPDEPEHLEDMVVDRVEPRKVANLLLWLILGFFVLFVLWASLSEIDRSVHAQGRIVPDSRLQVISNLEGGIVQQILVQAGDKVVAGQPLVRLDKTQRQADFGSNAVTAASLQAKIARLQAQITGRAPSYPSTAAPGMAEAVAIERALYASQVAELSSLEQAGQARILQSNRAVSEAEANYRSAQEQARNYEQQANMMRPLVERGIEPRATLMTLESQTSVARSQAQAAQSTISRMHAQVAEATSSLAQARQDWRSRSAAELSEAQTRLAALRSTLPALQDRVDRSVVTAPVAGEINRVLVSTVGGSIAAGQPLVELVPSGETLMIEGRLNPKDIGFVRLGQKARISITAYDSGVYGQLDGTVVSISPDATVDEQSGDSFYTVQVRSNGSLKNADGTPLQLGPGMTADISLLGDKRSVLSYILTPFTRLQERALRE